AAPGERAAAGGLEILKRRRLSSPRKAGRRNVARACALLKVSRAAFYARLSGPSKRDRQDAELAGQIRAVNDKPRGSYGAPRVPAELARRGRRHSRKRIAATSPISAPRRGGCTRPP